MEAMTMEGWRRRLLELMRAEQEARARVNERPGPAEAERAYHALRQARAALEIHYAGRPDPVHA